jgi:hypothetical protein
MESRTTKPLQSKRYIGTLIITLGWLLGRYGIEFSPEMQQTVMNNIDTVFGLVTATFTICTKILDDFKTNRQEPHISFLDMLGLTKLLSVLK